MTALRRLATWFRARPAFADGLLAVVVWAMVLPGLWVYQHQVVDGTDHHRADLVGVLLLSLATLPIAARRRWPIPVVVVTAAATMTLQGLRYGDSGVAIGTFVGIYTIAVYIRRPQAWWALAALLVAVAAEESSQHERIDAYLTNWLFIIATFLLGDNVRTRRAYVESLEERAARAEREQERRAVQAVADERARIAREMHDVVAHSMTVMVVQASAARRTRDRAAADRALEQIEATGRESLAEMRRLLGVLREEGAAPGASSLLPQPGLADLPDLAARAADAGLPVVVDVVGTARELPPGIDLTAYRIVQEALTNSHRHAGPARATVVLRWGARDLTIEVTDDGRGAAAPADPDGPGGHGLLGMRERVAVFDGALRAGPRRGGGWEVVARLPFDECAEARRRQSAAAPLPVADPLAVGGPAAEAATR